MLDNSGNLKINAFGLFAWPWHVRQVAFIQHEGKVEIKTNKKNS